MKPNQIKTNNKNQVVLGHHSLPLEEIGGHACKSPTESYDIEILLLLQNTKIFYQNSHLHCIYNEHVNNLVWGPG